MISEPIGKHQAEVGRTVLPELHGHGGREISACALGLAVIQGHVAVLNEFLGHLPGDALADGFKEVVVVPQGELTVFAGTEEALLPLQNRGTAMGTLAQPLLGLRAALGANVDGFELHVGDPFAFTAYIIPYSPPKIKGGSGNRFIFLLNIA